jgi:hypothetical protein
MFTYIYFLARYFPYYTSKLMHCVSIASKKVSHKNSVYILYLSILVSHPAYHTPVLFHCPNNAMRLA